MAHSRETLEDLVDQYRYICREGMAPIFRRKAGMIERGAAREFAEAMYSRDLNALLRSAGWTRELFDAFSQVDRLQRLRELATSRAARLGDQLGETTVVDLAERADMAIRGRRFSFPLPDGRVIEVRGEDMPALNGWMPSQDRQEPDRDQDAGEAPLPKGP